ncbi:hypothetical protein QFC24_000992 [Naganishia onofrii]|uniref:Uncharacterized protein n=1 Tax=Naganishia onofrii TaxID=1851511 RepID=A0ACC2XU79_9TREE|nr:hypothetical protein QFC24_000992 [Naganishia onofrii]
MRLQIITAIFAAILTLPASADTISPDATCKDRRSCIESEWCVNANAKGLDGKMELVGVCVPKETKGDDPAILCNNFNKCEPRSGSAPGHRYCTPDGVYNYCPPSQYCADGVTADSQTVYSCINAKPIMEGLAAMKGHS